MEDRYVYLPTLLSDGHCQQLPLIITVNDCACKQLTERHHWHWVNEMSITDNVISKCSKYAEKNIGH